MRNEFGKSVREAREAHGLSQEQLAEMVGATQSTIDRIESGATLRSRYMYHIAQLLGIVEYRTDYLSTPKIEQSIHASKPTDQASLNEKKVKLSNEIIERVRKFMVDYEVLSEDEALRQLINEGLMQYDHFISITDRLHNRLKEKKSLREAARYVLGNHPKVVSISYNDKSVRYELDDNYIVEMRDTGIATVWDPNDQFYEFSVGDEPEWAAPENLDPPQLKLGDQPEGS